MKNSKSHTRRGFTLLELMVTTAMLAALSASCMVIVRTSYTAWNRHKDDHSQRQAGLTLLRHIVREARQARAVVSISTSTDTTGSLSLLDANGNVLVWEHNGTTDEVRYGITTATDVLATDIQELTFEGFKVDGVTPTTDVGLIHSILCTTKVNITRPSGTETVTASGKSWLRAW